MSDNFLRLLLVVIVLAIISGPMSFFGHSNWKIDSLDFDAIPFNMDDFFRVGAIGIAAAFFGLLALMYALLLRPVFKYGAKMMFVQAARQITPDFDMLIQGFRKNYLNRGDLSLHSGYYYRLPACLHGLPGDGQGS